MNTAALFRLQKFPLLTVKEGEKNANCTTSILNQVWIRGARWRNSQGVDKRCMMAQKTHGSNPGGAA